MAVRGVETKAVIAAGTVGRAAIAVVIAVAGVGIAGQEGIKRPRRKSLKW